MSDRAIIVVYDIPEVTGYNPSTELRSFAFRINLSSWIMQEGDLTRALPALNHIREIGGDWHKLPIAEDGADVVTGLCVRFINEEIEERMTRGQRSLDGLTQNVLCDEDEEGATLTPEERAKQVKTYRSRAQAIVRRINLLLRDMRQLGQRWGIAGTQIGLVANMTRVAQIQQHAYRQAQEYVRATQELERELGASNPIVATAKQGAIPAVILADALDEIRADAGKALRESFETVVKQ